MNKVKKLRKFFKVYKLDGYIVPKNDEFFGEYIPEYKDNLKFISNFSGSYGFALIFKKKNYKLKLKMQKVLLVLSVLKVIIPKDILYQFLPGRMKNL